MLGQASEALNTTPAEQREFGSITLRLTREQVRELKRRIFEFGEEILQTENTTCADEAVYHFGFQLFPVSEVGGGAKDKDEP